MKKILLLNTKYREFGGEDSNILDEKNFLSRDYDVEYLEFDNSDKLKISDYVSFFTNKNKQSNKKLIDKIKTFNPDIVYVHNTWFKANLGIFKILQDLNIETILKIHNFRFSCTSSYRSKSHLKDDEYCRKCGFSGTKVFFNKYYKSSYLKSFFIIRYGKKYKKIIKNFDLKILVMTDFQKKYLIENGLSSKKIFLYENPLNNLNKTTNLYNKNSHYVVYAGRISDEKGVKELISSWKKSNIKNLNLKIIGQGESLQKLIESHQNENIEFLGKLENNEALKVIQNSRAVVTATKMYEGQPRLLCEASSMGIPSIFPNFGGMVEFFPDDYELKFDQYNYLDLQNKLNMLDNQNLLKALSVEVKSFINLKLSDEKLLNIFKSLQLNEQ